MKSDMELPLEELIKELEESGIVSVKTLKDFIPPKAFPKDGAELVYELVRNGKLTLFQAGAVERKEARSLVLGNYTLLEKIGQGGMGQVFKAEHRRMKRIVAVKTLPAATMQETATVARFQREVEAAAKINHPNVVAALDADEAQGIHFLVMEYVDGQDLSTLVRQNGALPVEQAVNYVIQAARGLEAAHKMGIVHRDVKPSNLLLDHEGTIKILDMGLARYHANHEETAELTSSGMIMGTADYMSPEQALDTRSADARADIYSLGCTLHFLLMARPVFSGETIMQRILAHRENPIPSLQLIRPEVSARIDAAYKKMIAKKASQRYQSMAELIADLEQPSIDSTGGVLRRAPLVDAGQTVVIREIESASTLTTTTAPPKGTSWMWIGGGVVGLAILVVFMMTQQFKSQSPVDVPKHSDAPAPAPAAMPVIVERDKRPGFQQPWFDDWLNQLKQMPAEEQVKAVREKLMELNPGFDGKLTPIIDDGRVISITFVTDHVTDLSPVRAFRKLKSLTCGGSDMSTRTGMLRDLSPLKGMSLEFLDCSANPNLVDLSPLIGMPLRELHFSVTGITELSSLEGMPLEAVRLQWTRVTSLEPLRGMSLKIVSGAGSRIEELSPLKDAPLLHLDLADTSVADLSPLEGASLDVCELGGTQVTDLSALRGMPLVRLGISSTGISNLEPLRGMPLKSLTLDHTKVTDITPLTRLKLTDVSFTSKTITQGIDILREMKSLEKLNSLTPEEFWAKHDAGEFGTPISPIKPITDFEALEFQQWIGRIAEMPAEEQLQAVSQKLMELNPGFDGRLTAFTNETTPADIERGNVVGLRLKTDQVTDLSPLRALRGLQRLNCDGGYLYGLLTDLSPLRGMGIRELLCSNNLLFRDLTGIKGLPLEYLDITRTQVVDLSPLRGMKLRGLAIQQTQVSDLSPLQGMPLEQINCRHSRILDLSPLNKARLIRVDFADTWVSDLQTLRGMPLEFIDFQGSWVSDLSPLGELDLLELNFTPRYVTKGLGAIRQMQSVRRITGNGRPSVTRAEFWKRYDAGEFGKPAE